MLFQIIQTIIMRLRNIYYRNIRRNKETKKFMLKFIELFFETYLKDCSRNTIIRVNEGVF